MNKQDQMTMQEAERKMESLRGSVSGCQTGRRENADGSGKTDKCRRFI